MKKTLILILNYNTPELTNPLYEDLKKNQSDLYDVFILDNGSDDDKKCKYESIDLSSNTFYGGGVNVAFEIILNNQELYDSLLLLNSDVIIHPYNFIKTLRGVMFNDDYKIVSSTIIQPVQHEQCYWLSMHNWNSKTPRDVKFVDFQSCLIHIDVIKKINQFDDLLKYGWGNDLYTGMICEENNWKICILDYCPIVHLGNYTVKIYSDRKEISNYNDKANYNMYEFFKKIGKLDKLQEYINYARTYKFE